MNKVAKISNTVLERDLPTIQIEYLGKVSQGVLANPKGLHSSPPLETPCLMSQVDSGNKFITPINTDRPSGLALNDIVLFALNLASSVKCGADGNVYLNSNQDIILNDGSDSAVSYQELDIVLQKLATDINTELGKINAVLPAYVPTSITIDLTAAEVEKVKL